MRTPGLSALCICWRSHSRRLTLPLTDSARDSEWQCQWGRCHGDAGSDAEIWSAFEGLPLRDMICIGAGAANPSGNRSVRFKCSESAPLLQVT